jgi:hypothetical protein
MTNRILFGISKNLLDTRQLIIYGFVVTCTMRTQTAPRLPACCQLVKFLQAICSPVTYNKEVAAIYLGLGNLYPDSYPALHSRANLYHGNVIFAYEDGLGFIGESLRRK